MSLGKLPKAAVRRTAGYVPKSWWQGAQLLGLSCLAEVCVASLYCRDAHFI